jgi:predicted DCC family thiol-disulfide oxidoreductase YuxK
MQLNTLETLSIFYDGNCPLCLAEIHVLKNNNQQQLLRFINIHDGTLVDSAINCAAALQIIHAQFENGKVIRGPIVFAEAYKRSDLTVMKWLFSFKLFQRIYALFYVYFAQYRHQISKLIGPFLVKLAKWKYPN